MSIIFLVIDKMRYLKTYFWFLIREGYMSSYWKKESSWQICSTRICSEPGDDDISREVNQQLSPDFFRYSRKNKNNGFQPGLILDLFF